MLLKLWFTFTQDWWRPTLALSARTKPSLSLATLIVLASLSAQAADPLQFYGFDSASYSSTAQEGLEEIYAGRLFHEAIPLSVARLALSMFNGAQRSAGYIPGEPDAMFYSTGALPSSPSRISGADPAFGLGASVVLRDGVQHVTFNCFACHAGVVRGQVVAGLGHSHINQSNPDRLATRGDNFGPFGVWRLGSRLADPANKGLELAQEPTELEAYLESIPLPPVDPMPWWLMKYKRKDYWYADASPHDAASFSINFTTIHPDMNAHHEQHVQSVAKALAFARETLSPPFPGSLDADMVQKGADLFHGRVSPQETSGFRSCKSCHGSYTRLPGHTDLSQPGYWSVDYDFSHVIRDVKSDTAYNATLRKFGPIVEHFNKLKIYYEARGVPQESIPSVSIPDSDGYVAPPLVGVWATAPYFHNGSVPTLDAVLDSQSRPEIWSRDNRDPRAYDLERVGVAHQIVSRVESDQSLAAAAGKPFYSQAAIEHGLLYDTTEFGHGNMGHTFGDRLTKQERQAIIEFLKSLSGPEMPPERIAKERLSGC